MLLNGDTVDHYRRAVAQGADRVAAPLQVIGLGINLLPELRIDVDLPSLPLPSIDIPEPPGWVLAILESAKYWGPILAGIVIAVREWRKRCRPPTRQPASTGSGPP